MLSMKTWALSIGTFFSVSFLLCVAWGLLTPASVQMHGFLEEILPGFRWLSTGSFVLGLVESFLWGVYLGVVFVPIHNFFQRRLIRA